MGDRLEKRRFMYFVFSSGFLFFILLPNSHATPSCCDVCDCTPGTVWCSQKGLNSVPDGIPTDVTKLYLFYNNISIIPEGAFSELKNLEILDLSSNQLTNEAFKPGVLDGLDMLKSLTLLENKLTRISKGTFTDTPMLMRLYLQDNLIEEIEDESFQNLTHMLELKLSSNRLTKIPKIFNSPRLRRLGLSNNQIKTIGGKVLSRVDLEELRLSRNRLSRIPTAIFGATNNMRLLDISDNKLTRPPPIISNMTSLHTLNLSGNFISTIPANYLEKSKKIKILDLSRLQLGTISRSLIPPRVYLNLFDVSGNPWYCDCGVTWLIEYMRRVSNAFSNLNNVKCTLPLQLQGRQLVTLTEDEYCENAPTRSTTQTPARSPEQVPTKKPTVDVCDALACANGASCYVNQTTHAPACRCLFGWRGLLCDQMIAQRPPPTPSTQKPPQHSKPGLVILQNSLTADSVTILLPINGKRMTLSTTIITAAGKHGKITHKSIFPTAHLYRVIGLEAGKKYNICISSVDVINTTASRRRIEDQLCAIVTTISVPPTIPNQKDDSKVSNVETAEEENGGKQATDHNKNSSGLEEQQNGPNSTVQSPNHANMEIWIAVVGGGLVLIILALVITVICYRRKKKKKHTNNNHNGRTVGEGEALTTAMQPYNQDTLQCQSLLRQKGNYYDEASTKHSCPSCASPSRVATPNRTESLGRSSNSGGSVQGTVLRHKDRQRCCSKSSDGQYSDPREDFRNATPPNGTIPRTTYEETRPMFNNRDQKYIYNQQHNSPTLPLESYAETSFREPNFPVPVVPVLSTNTNVNQFHHGSIAASEISPRTTYGYQVNGPVSMGGYPPGASVARPQPVAMHYTPSKQLRHPDTNYFNINDDYYNANHVVENHTQMNSPYIKTLKV